MTDYHIFIFYSEEDGGYIADIPDLDACSAFGETPEQALEELEKAKRAWIEAARQSGQEGVSQEGVIQRSRGGQGQEGVRAFVKDRFGQR